MRKLRDWLAARRYKKATSMGRPISELIEDANTRSMMHVPYFRHLHK